MNYVDIIDNFHFLRPLWLLAIVPLLMLILLLRKQVRTQSGWKGVLAGHLYNKLISAEAGKKATPPWLLLFSGWLLISLALAGPTWERLPQPVYQVSKGKVILLDMSMSMRAEDIAPNRLSRARFKAMDMLKSLQEGETGLVAYAGDAFVISPLTSDVQNLEALIPSLSPEIMPVQGSDAVFAIESTFELLKNAGYKTGDIFWITDGVDLSEIAPLRNLFAEHDYTINMLAVGTENGAPIKISNGNFLKDASGAVVIPKLRSSSLATLARSTGGRFVISRPDDADINYLTEPRLTAEESDESKENDSFGDQWREMGPWLLLLLLPMAAYSFRRGLLPLVGLMLIVDGHKPVKANWWDNLWQTPNQQGMKNFAEQNFDAAAAQFDDPMWKGLSQFKQGDFEGAANTYTELDTAEANFGLGNALAQAQQYAEAVEAYKRALDLDPDYPNALENKQFLEELMQQQQNDQNSDQENPDEGSEEEQQNQQGQSDQDGSQDESQEQQSQDQQSQDQQSQEQQSQESQQQQSEEQESQGDTSEQQNAEEDASQTEQQQSESDEQQESEQQEAQMQQVPEELTEEQKEQLQKIENWLRKVPDDPAFLLKRKMLLEQQRRQRQRLPGQQKNW